MDNKGRCIEILLIEDNPADIRLTKEIFKEAKINNNLNVVENGLEALEYLRKSNSYKSATKPDIIVLDLNMPKMDGREFLAKVKFDENFKRIPVIVLTTSESEEDILRTYDLLANCYITKPVDLDEFIKVVKFIEEFWLNIVKLPKVG